MGRILSEIIESQRTQQHIKPKFTFKINSVDLSSYLMSHSVSYSKNFGSASASFSLVNPENIFGIGGEYQLYVGDLVELFEEYDGDSYQFKKFYGTIENRAYSKSASDMSVSISCLDYIASLRNTDINLTLEGDKIKIENEILTPVNFTTPGEEMFAQVFNFSNGSIAQNPAPIIRIRETNTATEEEQIDGFQILYENGQLKFGSPLNTNNYEVKCVSYYTYSHGVYIEDAIEELIKAELGYSGDYLFDEISAANVVSNHLTTSYSEEEGPDENGTYVSYLTPNLTSESITIKKQLTAAYDPTQLITTTLASDYDYNVDEVLYLTDSSSFPDPGGSEYTIMVNGFDLTYTGKSSGNVLTGVSGSYFIDSGASVIYDTGTPVTTLTLESTDGLPSSGEASIAGDVFTWTSKDTTHLYGIPTSGENSLSSKPNESYLKYTESYEAGRVWSMVYDNITSTLTSSDFTYPSGYTINYIDHKYGRIIFDTALDTSETISCDVDYNFKSLQSTGIEINYIKFSERETENRFSALEQLKSFLAPNYIIQTKGNNKIYGRYLRQKITADYNLNLNTQLSYSEDSDLYTRVVMFGKNENPTNIMFNEGVTFLTSAESYKSLASNDELVYFETKDGWHSFKTYISNAGYITADDFVPEVYINNVKVDNQSHQVVAQPVTVEKTTETVTTTTSGKGGSSTSQQSYYRYKVQFAHQSLHSSQPIYIYDENGVLQYTIAAGSGQVDYSRGIWAVPGDELNSTIESLSTATYFIFYASDNVKIDYDNVIIYIKSSMIPDPAKVIVNADYEYIHTMTPVEGISRVKDGRRDTAVVTEFYASVPTGYQYAVCDMGQLYNIQAIDIISGFYKPDEIRKFDINFRMTLQYSLNNSDYYDIADETTNFEMQGGSAKSFEEDVLGIGFQARYFKILLDNVGKIDYTEKGIWAVAFSQISVYSDIILKSEAKLIPISYNSHTVNSSTTTINVDTTVGFDEPGSGETITAYIEENEFTYSGLTATSFTGVTIGSGESYATDSEITKSIVSDPDCKDFNNGYGKQGDRVYKMDRTSQDTLYSQEDLDRLSKAYLSEFQKENSGLSTSTIFAPYLNVGDTVAINDVFSSIIDRNYFISAIEFSGNAITNLTLNYYPS